MEMTTQQVGSVGPNNFLNSKELQLVNKCHLQLTIWRGRPSHGTNCLKKMSSKSLGNCLRKAYKLGTVPLSLRIFFFGDLTKLEQTGTVKESQSQFERLLSRAGRLTPAQQVGCFISGLRENLRDDVQATRPSSLSTAAGLA